MSTSTGITGPQDLAQTVRNAVDPLDDHVGYGTSAYGPEDEQARAKEMNKLLGERAVSPAGFGAACEDFVKAHPTRSIAVAATAGAACAALLFAVVDCLRSD